MTSKGIGAKPSPALAPPARRASAGCAACLRSITSPRRACGASLQIPYPRRPLRHLRRGREPFTPARLREDGGKLYEKEKIQE